MAASAEAAAVPAFTFNIPAKSLAQALIEFAVVSDISIGDAGLSLGNKRSAPLKGRYSVTEGLDRLLAGSPFTYQVIDAKTIRIVQRPGHPQSRPETRRPPKAAPALDQITVTALKRSGNIQNLPYSIAALTGLRIEQLGASYSNDLAYRIAGLTFTNLGTGRDKVFVRGLSDGSFSGRTQSIVGTYLDNTRIAFNAPDPSLKLVDIEQVEVLRGPQGSLYGAGALSGIYRIVTNKPVLDSYEGSATGSASLTKDGGLNSGFDAMVNIPVIRDLLAVRLVGYTDHNSGYIEDIRLDQKHANSSDISGSRLSVRLQASENIVLTAGANFQSISAQDTQYYQNDLGPMKRANYIAEPHDNDFMQLYITGDVDFSWGHLVSTTSYISHEISSIWDASLSVPLITGLAVTASPFAETTRIHTFNHETRLASNDDKAFKWLIGGFWSHYDGKYFSSLDVPGSGNMLPGAVSDIAFREDRIDDIDELAFFGELTYSLSPDLALTGGLRWSHSALSVSSATDGVANGGPDHIAGGRSKNGLTPKLVLSYTPDDDLLVYAQAAQGYRVGGININNRINAAYTDPAAGPLTAFESDRLTSFEIGSKASLLGHRLLINAAAFYVIWVDIQSDQLLPNGFTSITNAGDIHNLGLEMDMTYRPVKRLEFHGNLAWSNPKIARATPDLAFHPGVPSFSAGLSARYEWPLTGDMTGFANLDYIYVGTSDLTFNQLSSPQMGDYHMANLRAGVLREGWTITFFVNNLWNAGNNSFAFGNPFSLRYEGQITPPRPRTIGASLGWHF